MPNNFNLPFVLSVVGAVISCTVLAKIYVWPSLLLLPRTVHYGSLQLCTHFAFWD